MGGVFSSKKKGEYNFNELYDLYYRDPNMSEEEKKESRQKRSKFGLKDFKVDDLHLGWLSDAKNKNGKELVFMNYSVKKNYMGTLKIFDRYKSSNSNKPSEIIKDNVKDKIILIEDEESDTIKYNQLYEMFSDYKRNNNVTNNQMLDFKTKYFKLGDLKLGFLVNSNNYSTIVAERELFFGKSLDKSEYIVQPNENGTLKIFNIKQNGEKKEALKDNVIDNFIITKKSFFGGKKVNHKTVKKQNNKVNKTKRQQ